MDIHINWWYQSVRQDFIVPVNKERREMVGNIMLSFSTLAASFRLKAPLPPYLPPVEKARLRLVSGRDYPGTVRDLSICIGRGYTQTGCGEKPRCQGVASAPLLRLRAHNEGSDDGAGVPWTNLARCFWRDWPHRSRVRNAVPPT